MMFQPAVELLAANPNKFPSMRNPYPSSLRLLKQSLPLEHHRSRTNTMSAGKEKNGGGFTTAVYRLNLHCPQCVREIKKPLLTTQGVHGVEVDLEKSEIKVKGSIEVKRIHKLIEKWSKKKVELVLPKGEKQVEETEEMEESVRTISMKVHLHCEKCALDLEKKLLTRKDIYVVRTDLETQNLTVQGIVDSDKLLRYIRKKVHKHAEIIVSRREKTEGKEQKGDMNEVKAESSEETEIFEYKQEVKVEVKSIESSAPYFIHYVYAPQTFSDENPNSCCII